MKVKKYICALLAAALVFCGASPSFAADDGVISLLSAMGVIVPSEDGSFDSGASVTRAEFARMIVMASPYRDSVPAASSVFKDVPATNAYAPYIKVAVSNGLMSGYSDGSFKPSGVLPLEQAANVALKLLGYTAADFRGGFPEAQMSAFRSNGLSAGVSGGVGQSVTKGDAARIIYNLLNTTVKGGGQKYAETIGLKLSASGDVDYAASLSDSMRGPFTVTSVSSLISEQGLSSEGLTVYKNGRVAPTSDIKRYDIVYLNPSKTVVWAYDKKITGIYERATPSQNDPSVITVSGKEYEPESAAAFSALSSGGNLRLGSAVTLLMGRDGRVADAVSATVAGVSVVIYVTGTGSKTYTNANGREYVSGYIAGVTADGSLLEYPVKETWYKTGDVIKVGFEGNEMTTAKLSGGSVSGAVDAELLTIGTLSLSEDVRILDTYEGAYASVSVQRLDGVTIFADEVLCHEAAGGKITALILNDATGDCGTYGIITSAKKTGSDMSVSGEYSYLTGGAARSLSTQGSAFGVTAGPAKFVFADERLISMRNLRGLTGKVSRFDGAELTVSGTVGHWDISDKAEIYTKLSNSSNYAHATLDDATEAFDSGQSLDFYYDDTPDGGGQIRVIIIREQ